MSERSKIDDFLTTVGWSGACREPLCNDASFRRYERVIQNGKRAVLMDASSESENIQSFLTIAHHLAGLGFSAPQVFSKDLENGFLLLEDLGDDTFSQLLSQGGNETTLYSLAVDLLIALHDYAPAQVLPKGIAYYDDQRLLDEAFLLTDWYLPAIRQKNTSNEIRDTYEKAWRDTFSFIHDRSDTLVLRDYHVDNLLHLRNRKGIAACGLLDFQDAVAGPPAYDLVSLLEDARRDVTPHLVEAMLARYFSAFPNLDRHSFMTTYTILGAQRHVKVIGIFTRLCIRDGKAVYLRHIPRLWKLLERSFAHPALTHVATWFSKNLSADERCIPPCPNAF